MPRRAFVADLQSARDHPEALPTNVFNLENGEDDGTFHFVYKHAAHVPGVTVQAHITDVTAYPSEHSCLVYTVSENVPPTVNKALADMNAFGMMSVISTITEIASVLDSVTTGGSSVDLIPLDDDVDAKMDDAETYDLEEESEGVHTSDGEVDEDEGYDDEDDGIDYFGDISKPSLRPEAVRTPHQLKSVDEFNRRVRSDLRHVKAAGFRLSILGQPLDYGQDSYVLVSCRISHLDIPEDTLLAWGLERQDYIMLLIHYTVGYKTLEQVVPSASNAGVVLHVCMTKRHKISLTEAINAFSQLEEIKRSKSRRATQETGSQEQSEPELRALFISRPLDELLNNRLPLLLQSRLNTGLSWKGAEEFYQDNQGLNMKNMSSMLDKYFDDEEPKKDHLPNIVTADHMQSQHKDYSFPLATMQFMLRHLVRCTEFCLVCHCRIETNFEALKPYVCSKPLCLYQYMALGFGPSIEYDIIAQPYVVDLLISFCYSSAYSRSLNDFPLGMGLTVPEPSLVPACIAPYSANQDHLARRILAQNLAQNTLLQGGQQTPVQGLTSVDKNEGRILNATWDEQRSELLFNTPASTFSFNTDPIPSVGDWVVFGKEKDRAWQHRRILSVNYPRASVGSPTSLPLVADDVTERGSRGNDLELAKPLGSQNAGPNNLSATDLGSATFKKGELPSVDVIVYAQNFDDLGSTDQQSTICLLLSTLPSVTEMRDYLKKMGDKQMSLRSWTDRISPAALGILRWIIASNRSCIVQTDSLDSSIKRGEDRVAGMDGFMQFRFAQGAPDKEQRFIHSVQTMTQQLGLQHPTIFAWHGSPLENWHGIVREGLHFKNVLNGRAFGNGVYHSLDANTSLVYSSSRYVVSQSTALPSSWPSSLLKIASALSLNELVNAPKQYISTNPHLVVQHVDWIQTRYLFVKCGIKHQPFTDQGEAPTQVLEQDPTMRPKGINPQSSSSKAGGTTVPLVIPTTAIIKSRRPVTTSRKIGNKRVKIATGTANDPIKLEESESEASDMEDIQILLSDDEDVNQHDAPSHLSASQPTDKTHFVPGCLDWSTLPILAPPSYATSQASKALQRELKASLRVQESTPSHELGWYLSASKIENVYQWIVELHSFDLSLPLAQDMKAHGIASIVLELRFGATFPYSPPFVRIIRPRFLPFMRGGGGHVTAGGALCMELLTNTGWNPASSVEAVLLQVRLAMMSMDPKPARLETGSGGGGDYGVGEAVEAYKRACHMHGWQVPKDFEGFAGLEG